MKWMSSVSDLKCDYERTNGANAIVEPRRAIRGDIARSPFYMHVEYELPLNGGMLPMLKRWHVADPPNTHERWRNKQSETLQGIRNQFIDKPMLVDHLQ